METQRALYLALARMGERRLATEAAPGSHHHKEPLTAFELRVFSQNGEDGVLAEIFARVGAGEGFFVEFGAETGREGNCVYLADVANWRGLFVEGDADSFRLLHRKYRTNERAQATQAMVTPENVQTLFADAGVPTEPSILSIDVDGNDYWIWDAIDDYRPRVVVIEYNSALEPSRRLVQPADLKRDWDGSDYFGASLGALRALGDRKGYRLVHTELCGVNAFFVRDDLARGRFPDVDEVPTRSIPNYFQSGRGHPSHPEQGLYLDLDAGTLVNVLSPQGAPALPIEDEFSLWRDRALSAEEHLARSYAATADATAAYEHKVAEREELARELVSRAQDLERANALLADRDESLRIANDAMTGLRTRFDAREAELLASNAALVTLRSSKSWRLTAPLRSLSRAFRALRASRAS